MHYSFYQDENGSWIRSLDFNEKQPFISNIEQLLNQDQTTKYSVLKDQHNHDLFYVVDQEKVTKTQCFFVEFTIRIIQHDRPESLTIAFSGINNPQLIGHLVGKILSTAEKTEYLAVSVDSQKSLRNVHGMSYL